MRYHVTSKFNVRTASYRRWPWPWQVVKCVGDFRLTKIVKSKTRLTVTYVWTNCVNTVLPFSITVTFTFVYIHTFIFSFESKKIWSGSGMGQGLWESVRHKPSGGQNLEFKREHGVKKSYLSRSSSSKERVPFEIQPKIFGVGFHLTFFGV